MSSQTRRWRDRLGTIVATVLLPFVIMGLGLWETSRGTEDWQAFVAQRDGIARTVELSRPAGR